MNLGFDTNYLIEKLLPRHKRQPSRRTLFAWPLDEIQNIYNDFNTWRDFIFKEVNITGQKISLQYILNQKIENSGGSINIQDFDDGGLYLSLENEDLDFAWMSEISEGTDFIEVANKGEEVSSFETDFRVYAPLICNEEAIAQITEIYKLAGKTYEIIQN